MENQLLLYLRCLAGKSYSPKEVKREYGWGVLSLSIANRGLRQVRAGHDTVLIVDPDTDEFYEFKGHDRTLGLDYTFKYWVWESGSCRKSIAKSREI